jgi:hypothetical protein
VNSSHAQSARREEKVGHVDSEEDAKKSIQPSLEGDPAVVQVQFDDQRQRHKDFGQDQQTDPGGQENAAKEGQGGGAFLGQGEEQDRAFECQPPVGSHESVGKDEQGKDYVGGEASACEIDGGERRARNGRARQGKRGHGRREEENCEQ